MGKGIEERETAVDAQYCFRGEVRFVRCEVERGGSNLRGFSRQLSDTRDHLSKPGHLFDRMQRLNTYEAKTNPATRIGSNLSQVLPPLFSCE